MGNTTSPTATACNGSISVPEGSSGGGPSSASTHRPSRVMPTGVTSYRERSTAPSTDPAEMHDTSCSADWPPNRRTRRTRSGRSGIRGNVPRVRFRTGEVAAASGGRLEGPDVAVDGVSIDSRADVAGRLFVPIVAERDGHDFVAAALAAGAAAYLTARTHEGGTAVVVE